jgi:5-methylcytosine-specific restriction endonuclease McrA
MLLLILCELWPGRPPAPIWDVLRRAVLRRDDWHCVGCGKRKPLDIHHVWPLSQGGSNRLMNMVALCRDCHQRVHGRKF